MSNPYDALAASLQPQDPTADTNPYDAIVEDIALQQQQRARTVFEKSLATDPDQAAEAVRLAKQTGLPADTVERNLDEVRRKEMARRLELERLAVESPVLARQLADPTFTKQAHDDIGALEQVGQFFTNTGRAGKAGVFNASRGAAGVFQAGLELAAPALDVLEPVTTIGGNPLRRLAEGFAMMGGGAGQTAKAAMPRAEGNIAAGYYSGIQSLTQNMLALPMAFLPGGQAAALSFMSASTGGQSYQDAREQGLSMSQALPFAASQAAIEYATERMPLGALIGDVKVGTSLVKTLGKQLALEIPGEQIATILQDMNEWAALPENKDKPFRDYIAERPDAAAQTLVATIVGTGGNVVVARGIESATRRLAGDAYEAGLAEQSAEQLQAAMQTAAQSMLRQRNPEEFRALMQRMAENTEGAPQEVYLDAEVLNQLPQDVLQQLPENVLGQLAEALAANGTVAIPVADVLTVAPGTPLEQALVENARVGDPMALTQAEAAQAGEQAQQFLAQEAERVIAQAQDAAAMQASSDNVKQGLLDQLNTAGRFAPAVNEAYATWTTAFYTTMAGRLGISPEEMAARYPLKIGAQAGQGATLEQGDGIPAFHGTALEFDDFMPNDIRGGTISFAFTERRAKEYASGSEFLLKETARKRGEVSTAAGKVIPVKLNVRNVFDPEKAEHVTQVVEALTAAGATPPAFYGTWEATLRDGVDTELETKPVVDAMRSLGFDAQYVRDGGSTAINVFSPGSIVRLDRPQQTLAQSAPQTETPEFKNWFGESKVVDASGKPLVVYHGTTADFDEFLPASHFGTAGQANAILRYQQREAEGGASIAPAYLRLENPKRVDDVSDWAAAAEQAKAEGYDGLVYANWGEFDPDADGNPQDSYIAFDPTQIKSAIGNRGTFDPNDPNILNQGARATFNPETLELVLNENADLSSFLHETAHFFLEVMADLSSQPDAPAEIQQDMAALLKWFGIKGAPPALADISTENTAPAGTWLRLPYPDMRGTPVAQVRELNVADLYLPELNENGDLQPEKRSYLEGYTARAAAGEQAPNISVVEMEDGRMRVVDGHRRVLAARAAGQTTIRATVSPLMDSADGRVPMVAESMVGDPVQTWNAMTLDQKRKYHERFAESFEQYLLEGKAPSLELQPLFRKFKRWMENVYTSLKNFIARHPDSGIVLSPEIRQVFDRMLATREQIAQAEEVAGLVPDENATEEAVERLTARSLRDLKWTVNARAKEIKKLQKQAASLRKGVEAEVRAEVEQMPVYRAMQFMRTDTKIAIADLENLYMGEGDRYALLDWKPLTDKRLAGKDGVHPDILADMFGFASGDAMVRAILSAEPISSVVEGMTDRRMLEEHGDLVDQRAIEEAANAAVHNEARARSLATELKAQADLLGTRQDTGRTNAAGRPVTVSVIAEAAKQFAANVVARTPLKELKARAWQHVAAERRAGKRWQEATAAGETEAAVKAKQDQVLNNAAAKAATEAQAEVRKITEFFKRVVKGTNEKVVEKGRDPDVVNAARAILAAYSFAPRAGKTALEYLEVLQRNDAAMFAALQPSIQGALAAAKPLDTLTLDELRSLHDEIQAMWHLAKRSRQMEIDGNLLDIEDAEADLQTRMQEIGVPSEVPGEKGAITPREAAQRKLQYARSLLRRVEQWAEGMDGKFGGPFLRLVFQPVKDAADRYRADRVKYRKAYQALVDQVAPHLRKGEIAAPELGYTFGRGHNGVGHAELLHAILHTGNESNKRKLLLGRKWATENPDGTLDTARWDAFIARMHSEGVLRKEHYDFAQGVWDLLEQTKALAQKTHRDVFGRYFAEVTADEVVTPFGTYRGGYVPAQADPQLVQDADLRKLIEAENENMSFSFPSTNRGFAKERVEYNRPLVLDLRSIGQHLDKVLLFSHMEAHVRDVQKLLSRKGVSYSLSRIDPTAYAGMLTPWLSRSARQVVETPVVGDGGLNRILTTARNRAGMALMFANVSNTLQQITGFSLAAIKVKPALIMKSAAQFIAHPKQTAKTVADASPFMANRMENEVAAINDAIDQILLDPNLYERAQAWTQKHAYFLQTAMANTMEPIIWTAAYNQAVEQGQDERDAVRFADNVIRTTQGSTLPEDVSRIETGPAYARAFTQFVGYFNMMANTNGTALQQIARELGVKKGAGKMLYVVTLGLLAPLWVAEAIALSMRGGPEDEDDDGYLDDWLASVFGMGTIKGTLAMVPFVGQLGNAAINRMNNNPADDRVSLSPAVSLLEAAAGVPSDAYKLITDPEKLSARNAVRDVASLISITTGLPAYAVARPAGYLAGVADGRIDPTSAGDAVRGAVTGVPSPESR